MDSKSDSKSQSQSKGPRPGVWGPRGSGGPGGRMPGGRMPGAGPARQRAQIKHISIGFYPREGRYMVVSS